MKQSIFLSLTFFFVLCSCSNGKLDYLRDIESYIQQRPDSALVQLQAINCGDLKSGKERALFSLLTAMALDKNYIDTTDISIIEPAVTYYGRHRSHDHYAAAMFYSGRIHYNGADYSKAISSFQDALESTETPYWRSMIFSHLGYCYNMCFNNEEELVYAEKAFETVSELGDSLAFMQTMSTLALAYQNNRMFRQADSLLAVLCDVPYYAAFPQRADLQVRQAQADYDNIVSMFETGISNGVEMSVVYWCEYAYALYKCGNTALSESIFNQLSQDEDNMYFCIWKAKLAEDQEDFETALAYEKKYEILADSLVREQLSQSVFKEQSAYLKTKLEIKARQHEKSIMLAVIVILAIILSATYIMLAAMRRQKAMEENIESLSKLADESESMLRLARQDLSDTKSDLFSTEARLLELRKLYARTYQSQFSEIGRLFDYGRSESGISREAVMKYKERTDQIIMELRHGPELQSRFEERINQDLDNIMVKLRSDFPQFKESDFRFLSYLIVGFDATTRSILMNETVNNMRVKKARLLKKIRSSQTGNMALYSCFLFPDK